MNLKKFVVYVYYSRCLQDVPLNLLLMKKKKKNSNHTNFY